MSETTRALVVMGVSGCGKSTIATALCQRTRAQMIEGDDFHPPSNIQKMRAGTPLTDADRQGWLDRLGQEVVERLATAQQIVCTCSALKRRYREQLRHAIPNLGFIFLDLTMAEATARVAHRHGHFMPASLVQSQFRDLEPPRDEPLVLTLSGSDSVDDIADKAARWWFDLHRTH
jgi:gluconokinase